MSDNDKWVWASDDEPIPALFRPEPSTSKTDPSLRLLLSRAADDQGVRLEQRPTYIYVPL